MLFAYLIASVTQLSGPVVSYYNFPMTNHVQAEYFRSATGACTIGVSFKRRGDESELVYAAVDVKSETGEAVPIVTMEGVENVTESRIYQGYSARVILPGEVDTGVNPDVLTSYIINAGAGRFSYDVDVRVVDNEGVVVTESESIFCDMDNCKCSTRGPKYASRRR